MSIIKQAAAFLTGADEIGFFGRRLKRSVATRKSRIAHAWGKAFPRIVSTPSIDPYAAFREIAIRNRLDQSEIQRRATLHWRLFAAYFLAVAVAFAFAIGTVRPAMHSALGFPGAVMPFFVVLPLSALAIRHAFWHWQLRTQSVGSFKQWVDRPREWLPVILIAGASATALLDPGALHAATLQNCQHRSKTEPPGAWVTGRKLSHAGSGYLGSALAFGTTPPFLLSRSR